MKENTFIIETGLSDWNLKFINNNHQKFLIMDRQQDAFFHLWHTVAEVTEQCLKKIYKNVVLSTVGSRGSVLSLELRDDHHRVAVKNYNRWRASWCVRRGEDWPDNVHFVRTDLCSASSLLAGQGFNAVSTRFRCHDHFAFFRPSMLIVAVSFIAGGSGSLKPTPGLTCGDPTPAPWGCVCRLPCQVSAPPVLFCFRVIRVETYVTPIEQLLIEIINHQIWMMFIGW